jgi:hypothetical protein
LCASPGRTDSASAHIACVARIEASSMAPAMTMYSASSTRFSSTGQRLAR